MFWLYNDRYKDQICKSIKALYINLVVEIYYKMLKQAHCAKLLKLVYIKVCISFYYLALFKKNINYILFKKILLYYLLKIL